MPDGLRDGSASYTNGYAGANGASPSQDRLVQEVSEVKRQLERMGQALRYPRVAPASGSLESALYVRLIEAELEPALAQRAAQGTPLEELFETDATLGRALRGKRPDGLMASPGPPHRQTGPKSSR